MFHIIQFSSVQNLSSSFVLPKILKIKIYRTIILAIALCGYETSSLTLKEGHNLRVFEDRMLKKIHEVRGG
jgi:hypothetical protein